MARKGEIAIAVRNGRLQLRWTFQGRRYYLSTGFPDTPTNHVIAAKLAGQIEFDMATLSFDETLAKYRTNHKKVSAAPLAPVTPSIRVGDLWSAFKAVKREEVTARTFAQYESAYRKIQKVCGNVDVSEVDAEAVVRYMKSTGLSLYMCKRYLISYSAIWSAIPDLDDPWTALRKRLKVPPKQQCAPFTAEEVQRILLGFERSSYYSYYLPFVKFLFGTGVRTGEAIGLRWKHISSDFSNAWIGEIITRGLHRSVKTNKARNIPLSNSVQQLLRELHPATLSEHNLVFPSLEGCAINTDNFRCRAWKSVLKEAGVPYRKPYNTRHTFISHCLEQKLNPAIIAQITGHSIETLYSHYAGVVNSRPEIPDYF